MEILRDGGIVLHEWLVMVIMKGRGGGGNGRGEG